jgi:uncharacterized membrane protein YvbJ
LVYCTKCGTENDDEALVCKNCGASLKPSAYKYRRNNWDLEDDCFGGRSRTTWPMIIGIFLIILGASTLLDDVYWWAGFDVLWPLFIIAIGVLILVNAMKR